MLFKKNEKKAGERQEIHQWFTYIPLFSILFLSFLKHVKVLMKKGLQFGGSYDIINLFTFVLVFWRKSRRCE